MSTMASQITGISMVCSTVCSGAKNPTKTPRHWPLWGTFTGHRWIPLKKGQWRRKCFHWMTSSCWFGWLDDPGRGAVNGPFIIHVNLLWWPNEETRQCNEYATCVSVIIFFIASLNVSDNFDHFWSPPPKKKKKNSKEIRWFHICDICHSSAIYVTIVVSGNIYG